VIGSTSDLKARPTALTIPAARKLDKDLNSRRCAIAAYPGGVSSPREPPGLLRRWEALNTGVQAGIVFPLLAVLLFIINLGAFNQPLWRSILYGLIESAPLTALVLVATANEPANAAAADRREVGYADRSVGLADPSRPTTGGTDILGR
jgi:hypothetical protein